MTEGRYSDPSTPADALTEEEDAGLRLALDSAEAGQVKPADQVRRRLEELVARGRALPDR